MTISIYPHGSSYLDHRQLWPEGDPVPEGFTTLVPPDPIEDHTVEWDGETWAQIPTPLAPEPTPEPALPALTPRQFGMMLIYIGMDEADIETAINAIEDPQERALALVEFRKAGQYERDHPLVVSLSASLEFEATELDALWSYAAEL